jgi:hypothetical protein
MRLKSDEPLAFREIFVLRTLLSRNLDGDKLIVIQTVGASFDKKCFSMNGRVLVKATVFVVLQWKFSVFPIDSRTADDKLVMNIDVHQFQVPIIPDGNDVCQCWHRQLLLPGWSPAGGLRCQS